jgi:xanthine dehydrogenase accessory factor
VDYRGFYLELKKRLERNSSVEVTTVLAGEHAGEKRFAGEEGEGVFCETFLGRVHAVLCGGGHVSLAAAQILKMLEYELTVIDDREEYANAGRFPMADHILCLDFEKDFSKVSFPPRAYYVILTRGHEHDYTCLADILTRSYEYLGMIGSRTKVSYQKEKLRREGVPEEKIESIHAPIGLPIGGQTPEEIAVSIAAEMIQVKNRSSRNVLEEAVKEGLSCPEAGTMVTVVEKYGSSPRGKGSRMVVTESGKSFGTIGGGAIEHRAVQQALSLCKDRTGFFMQQYDLSDSEAADLGMVCGGRVKVMFETYQ